MIIGEIVNMVENNMKWKINLFIGNYNVKFKIDIGVDIIVICEDFFC